MQMQGKRAGWWAGQRCGGSLELEISQCCGPEQLLAGVFQGAAEPGKKGAISLGGIEDSPHEAHCLTLLFAILPIEAVWRLGTTEVSRHDDASQAVLAASNMVWGAQTAAE
jgi:hypothetical protein